MAQTLGMHWPDVRWFCRSPASPDGRDGEMHRAGSSQRSYLLGRSPGLARRGEGGSLPVPLRAAFGSLSKFEGNFGATGKIDYGARDMYTVGINAHRYASSIDAFDSPDVFSYT